MGVGPRVLMWLPLVLLAGCGNTRTPVPSATQPSTPDGFTTLPRPHAAVPAGPRALDSARVKLVAAVHARDRTLRLLGTSLVRVDGASAIELNALERIAGRPRRVTSTHVYVPGAELVLDEYAPPAQFPAVDRSVFGPVRRSLALVGAGGG